MCLFEPEAEAQHQSVVRDWHALYTRHQHEKSVAQVLANKGHEVFLPLVCATHQWRDRAKQLSLPLFPCYVFIRGGFERRLQILSTPGIINVVGCAGDPATIPQAQIDSVRRMIESPLRVEPHPFLQCGDKVRVEAGPLRGIEGLLVRQKNVFRLVVSVEILGRAAAVEIDISCVKRIGIFPVAMQSHSLSAFA
jgi:transcription antitermination factor NusG